MKIMFEKPSLETRVATLEQEVEFLKQQATRPKGSSSWLDQVVGSMKDFPEFEEVLRLGRELREQDRPVDEDPPQAAQGR